MRQSNVHGLLVWDDEYFQRGACAPSAEIDAEEAGNALVSAVLKHPQRAQALSDALAEPRKPQPYRAPAWADWEEEAEAERRIAQAERDREALEDR